MAVPLVLKIGQPDFLIPRKKLNRKIPLILSYLIKSMDLNINALIFKGHFALLVCFYFSGVFSLFVK